MRSQTSVPGSVTLVNGGDYWNGNFTGAPSNLLAADNVSYGGGSGWDRPCWVQLRLAAFTFTIPPEATVCGLALLAPTSGEWQPYIRYSTITGQFRSHYYRYLIDPYGYGQLLDLPWGGPSDLWEPSGPVTPDAINSGLWFDLDIHGWVGTTDVFGLDCLAVQVWYSLPGSGQRFAVRYL